MKLTLLNLSIFLGALSGLITIYLLPARYEWLLWLVVIMVSSKMAATNFRNQLFLKGLLFVLPTGMVVTLTHIILVTDYLASHSDEIQQLKKLHLAHSYRLTLLAIAPIYWILLGLLTGASALLWRKVKTIKQQERATANKV